MGAATGVTGLLSSVDLARGTPSISRDNQGRAVEVMRSWYRPDVYQIRVELSRQRNAPFKWPFTDPGRA